MRVRNEYNLALSEVLAKQTLYNFIETEEGESVGFSSPPDPLISTTNIAPLGEWFSRPVKLKTYEWDEGTSFATDVFSPWDAYFTTTTIRHKLDGYSRMRCNLKLKVVVNGSPFRFGEAMMSYRPLYSASSTSTTSYFPLFSGGQISGDRVSISPDEDYDITSSDKTTLMARSQRMNLRIQPHVNSGGVMTLPFVYYKDSLDIGHSLTNLSRVLKEMGTIWFESVTPLRSTATANSTGVSIVVYAWAENVELWGPTAVSIQGVDEFEGTMVPSEAASTVAEAAGMLAKVPVIGKYALATQYLSSAASDALKYFGWSNPPVLTAVKAKMPKSSYMNPNPCLSFQDDVIALDPKNELTVDPRTVGTREGDPLLITDFCSRMAIVDVLDWKVTDPSLTTIAEFPVHPIYYHAEWRTRTAPKNSTARITMLPATYAAQLFEYWRGTFVVKVKAVASQFHRGRLLITWDPAQVSAGQTYVDAAVISHVVDLATATEETIKIPFMSDQGMLRVSDAPFEARTSALCSATRWSRRVDGDLTEFDWTQADMTKFTNGVVTVRVLNQLQCGDATADVPIVFEMGFEDMQLMCPRVDGSLLTTGVFDPYPSGLPGAALTDFTIQGLEAPGMSEDMQMIPSSDDDANVARLYGGEVVKSLRSLLHRTYAHHTRTITATGTKFTLVNFSFPRFPMPMHSKVNAYGNKIPYNSTDLAKQTNILTTTPIAYLTACFTGYRGSFVWKAHATHNARTITLSRKRGVSLGQGAVAYTNFNAAVDYNSYDTCHMSQVGACQNGMSWNSQHLTNVASGVFPQYNNYRMMPGNINSMYRDSTPEPSQFDLDCVKAAVLVQGASGDGITMYASVAAGTDFNVFHYVNVPDIYLRSN